MGAGSLQAERAAASLGSPAPASYVVRRGFPQSLGACLVSVLCFLGNISGALYGNKQTMEELYSVLGSYSLWSAAETEWSTMETLTIWRSANSTRLWIQHSGPTTPDLLLKSSHDWTPTTSDEKDEDFVLVARMIFVGKDGNSKQKYSRDDLLPIVDHLGLRLAYDHALSCVNGVAAHLTPESNLDIYSLTYHPKLACIWSSTPSPISPTQTQTQALILAGPRESAGLKSLIDRPWPSPLTSHALFPAFLSGLLMSQEVDETQNSLKIRVRGVEVRTGHHSFANRREQPAKGELGELSAMMSGFATKLASTARKISVAKEMQRFMKEEVAGCRGEEVTRWIEGNVKVMERRLEMQLLDNKFLLERVRIQLDAIFNLIAQKNSFVGLQTARASQLTALSSLHDSSSMKTLALLALVFLPGNFVAALFSAPLFDWDGANSNSIGVGVKPQFNLFWAITVPLTLVSFVLYLGWSIFISRQKEKVVRKFEVLLNQDTLN